MIFKAVHILGGLVFYKWLIMPIVMNWICLQQSMLNPNWRPHVMVLGGGAFARLSAYEGGAPMNRISTLMKETSASSSALSTMWGHNKLAAIYESGSSSHQTLFLDS